MNGIVALPDHVKSQIRSAALITSLNDVAVELFKNSLDASAHLIDVSIDYGKGDCITEDDGSGICPKDFEHDGNLAKPYCSSRDDGGSGRSAHGQQGLFLASLSSLAVLSITSRHQMYLSFNEITWHYGKVVARDAPLPPYHHLTVKHGTRVRVRNLFGNLPVRLKYRADEAVRQNCFYKEWRELKSSIVALILAWPESLDVIIRNSTTGEKLVSRQAWRSRQNPTLQACWDDDRLRSILCHSDLMPFFKTPTWTTVEASTSDISVMGLLSLEAVPTQRIQFLSMYTVPLSRNSDWRVLYDSINELFADSSFGEAKQSHPSDAINAFQPSSKDPCKDGKGIYSGGTKTTRKRLNCWPMFYFRINTSRSSSTASQNPGYIGMAHASFMHEVEQVLHIALSEFLKQGHLRPRGTSSAVTQNSTSLHAIRRKGRAGQTIPMDIGLNTEYWNNTSRLELKKVERESARSDSTDTRIKPPEVRAKSWVTIDGLDSLSRIRSGGKRLLKDLPRNSNTDITHIEHNMEASITKQVSSQTILPVSPALSSVARSASIMNQSGKVITRPFVDVYDLDQASLGKVLLLRRSIHIADSAHKNNDEDHCVHWYDGINKETIIVDARTGNMIPSTNSGSASSDASSPVARRAKPLSSAASFDKRVPSPWVRSFLQTWENPVFQCVENAIPHVNVGSLYNIASGGPYRHGQFEGALDFSRSSPNLSQRVSKVELHDAQVIAQVDSKFILIKTRSSTVAENDRLDNDFNRLVLVDQHAADERYQVEQLMRDLFQAADFEDNSTAKSILAINYVQLDKALSFSLPRLEVEAILTHEQYFQRWGIQFTGCLTAEASTLLVSSLPRGIAQRCRAEPKLLIELIRAEVWKLDEGSHPSTSISARVHKEEDLFERRHSWFKRIQGCPRGIIDLLNSRACRSAIMFNDELSISECSALVLRLSDCAFPFQCAHGRPSMVPLVDLSIYDGLVSVAQSSSKLDFGTALKAWQN